MGTVPNIEMVTEVGQIVPEAVRSAFTGKAALSLDALARVMEMDPKTLRAAVQRGEIMFIHKGSGIERPRRTFTLSDVADYYAHHRPSQRGKAGFVYFIGLLGFVKIGFARNVKRRLGALQLSFPLDLKLLATTPGTQADERRLHARFAAHHQRGEWFRHEGELAAFLASPPKLTALGQNPAIDETAGA